MSNEAYLCLLCCAGYGPMKITQMTTTPMSDSVLSKTLGEKISCPNRVAVTPDSYASIVVGFPELVSLVLVVLCLRLLLSGRGQLLSILMQFWSHAL